MTDFEPRWYHVGPHAYFDLVRLARQGRTTLVRIGYVLALFAALAIVYYNSLFERRDIGDFMRDPRPGYEINANAVIAERFSITILILQNIAVLILMPIYVAASVFEERDHGTLPMLFTTDLSSGEIVRGKWLDRVVLVGSVLLGGLPVLSFVQLWGGIDMPMIAANYLNTGCWLLTVGSFSMMMATQSRSLAFAVGKTYAWLYGTLLVVFCCCCWPMVGPEWPLLLFLPFQRADGYANMGVLACIVISVHVALTYWFLNLATENLESQRGDASPVPEIFDPPDQPPVKVHRETEWVPDDPLAWREERNRSFLFAIPLLALPYMILAIGALIPTACDVSRELARTTRLQACDMFLTIARVASFIHMLLIAMRFTGCIVGEREQQTLDGLRTLPISSDELLLAKMRGNLLRHWSWILPLALYWPVTLFLSERNPLAGVLLLLVVATDYFFFAMLGLCLSVVCRTSVAAYSILAIVALTVIVGTALLQWSFPLNLEWVNPVGAWIATIRHWRFDEPDSLVASTTHLLTYGTCALVLGVIARWRFGNGE
ncbi:MAG: hypothetical protein FJ303_04065 [Planctomycetes bacterium]|nr:hypothetical protein [Planctomycetota bacterium]